MTKLNFSHKGVNSKLQIIGKIFYANKFSKNTNVPFIYTFTKYYVYYLYMHLYKLRVINTLQNRIYI